MSLGDIEITPESVHDFLMKIWLAQANEPPSPRLQSRVVDQQSSETMHK